MTIVINGRMEKKLKKNDNMNDSNKSITWIFVNYPLLYGQLQ